MKTNHKTVENREKKRKLRKRFPKNTRNYYACLHSRHGYSSRLLARCEREQVCTNRDAQPIWSRHVLCPYVT